MQRSRRALLQRRALEEAVSGRNRLYKVSLSLVFVLWGLVFLLSLWISRGDSYRDGSGVLPSEASTWNEDKSRRNENSDFVNRHPSQETGSVFSGECLSTKASETGSRGDVLIASEKNGKSVSNAEHPEVDTSSSALKPKNRIPKADQIFHAFPVSLDEFKSRAFTSKSKSRTGQSEDVIHRMEPGGTEYNYASASKGAKVLAYNKEAKGAANILSGDKDKYLRNPCSAEEKFVVVELSEETLVDTIEIANFEHHASNLRDFEVLGSLIYPSDAWFKLGNFTYANVKLAQRFNLEEPRWVRYLKLNLLNHHGSEFYCTLSVFEVYGVDAVERMLEDLISVQDNVFLPDEGAHNQNVVSSPVESSQEDYPHQNVYKELEIDSFGETIDVKHAVKKSNMPDRAEEIRHQQVGRMPGDTVLKILMQKVRSLDLNLSVMERYLEELNSRYGNIFKEFEEDIGEKDVLMERIRSDIKTVLGNQEAVAKDVDDLISWKSLISMRLDILLKDNADLRSKIDNVQEKQVSMENKGIVIFVICLTFGILVLLRLLVDMLLSFYFAFWDQRTKKSGKFCRISSSWLFLLLICSIILLIQSL